MADGFPMFSLFLNHMHMWIYIICILQTLNVWPKFYLHFGSLDGKLAALEILAHENGNGPKGPMRFGDCWTPATYFLSSDWMPRVGIHQSQTCFPSPCASIQQTIAGHPWGSVVETNQASLHREAPNSRAGEDFCEENVQNQYRNHGTGIFTYMKGQWAWQGFPTKNLYDNFGGACYRVGG